MFYFFAYKMHIKIYSMLWPMHGSQCHIWPIKYSFLDSQSRLAPALEKPVCYLFPTSYGNPQKQRKGISRDIIITSLALKGE